MPIRDAIDRAPLVPAAVLAIAGILVDRYCEVPGPVWAVSFGIGLTAWLVRRHWLALALAICGFAGMLHHIHRNVFDADDIGFAATDEPRLVQLRGRLIDEPTFDPPAIGDPLRSIPDAARTRVVMAAEQLGDGADLQPVSGRVAVTLIGNKSQLRAGDELELTGWLARPRLPDNPGERDYASMLLDQRIRATMMVRHVGDATSLTTRASSSSWDGGFAKVRAWAERQFSEQLPEHEAGIASALLLGDGAAMNREDWQRYIRTGVVHVLAVSGQHLTVLAGFVWFVLRGPGITRRRAALLVAIGIIAYGALTGNRPPVARAVVMVVVACLAILMRRFARPGNTLALAAIVVLLINPADIVDPGCQFSFLCVAVLIWGTSAWLNREPDPLQRIEDQMRPAVIRWMRAALVIVIRAYLTTLILGLVVLPLTAARYHLVSPIGIVIGPPAIVLASIALVAGFVQLLIASIVPPAAMLVAPFTKWSLWALSALVNAAEKFPGGSFYVGEVSLPWLLGFYVILAAVLWLPAAKIQPGWCLVVALAWTTFGLGISLHRTPPEGLVTTFLAVGHGGATVLEFPDGRVVLCDAGSMSGPDITRRVIAPFLWHRGVRRIDEVFLSHADLDHFNGLPSLLERFHVGQASVTPTFATKPTPGVGVVLDQLKKMNIPIKVRQAGDVLSGGNIELEVWHPPSVGPPGPENARSLVLAIRHEGHTIVLTGDLDLEGRSKLLTLPRTDIDVWQAPHHGGRTANPPELATWARPRIAIAHNATGEARQAAAVYENAGSRFLGTWPDGAVTVTSRAGSLEVRTFRGRHNWEIHQLGGIVAQARFSIVDRTRLGYDIYRPSPPVFFRALVSSSHVPSTTRLYVD